jgi:hypothetical protein
MMRMGSPQKQMGSPAAPAVAGPSFKAYSSARRAASSPRSPFFQQPGILTGTRGGKRIERTFLLDIPQTKGIRRVEIHDIPIGCDSPDVTT